MEIITSQTPKAAAGSALTEILRRYQETPVLLMLSGGSALAMLAYVDEEVLGAHITITTFDERFSLDPAINNFLQITTTDFYKKAKAKGVQIIDTTPLVDETLFEAGARIEASLRMWRKHHPEGIVVATMGVGSDGHTAGIFPGDHGVDFSGEAWVQGYVLPIEVNQYTERITVTYAFMQTQVAEALVFITGEEKRHVLHKLREDPFSLKDMPAVIIRELKSATVITDISQTK